MPIADDHGPIAAAESVDVKAIASATDPSSPQSGRSTDPERIAGRVSQFLLAHRPTLFCDDCIADRLGLSHRRQANRVTRAMANSAAFWRAVGACSACNKHKQVIRYV